MSSAGSAAHRSLSELLRELEALRNRLDQAQAWFHRPHDSMKAGALAEEVKRLCQDACRSHDAVEINASLDRARALMDELQGLLGRH